MLTLTAIEPVSLDTMLLDVMGVLYRYTKYNNNIQSIGCVEPKWRMS